MKINDNNIRFRISQVCNSIFLNYKVDELSSYEIRKIIFNYLCDNLEYDWQLYKNIKDDKTHEPVKDYKRDNVKELENAVFHHKGICNAIAQYYKLLLEHMNIYSVQICCDDGTIVKHALNLVYDQDNDIYSFDDVTSVIVNKGSIDDYFDYDLEDARNLNQGKKILPNNNFWFIISSSYINYLCNDIDNVFYKQFGLENKEVEGFIPIPKNICSLKKQEFKYNNKSR